MKKTKKNSNAKTSKKSFATQTGAIPPSIGFCMRYPSNNILNSKN
jgi:hypothetical protein